MEQFGRTCVDFCYLFSFFLMNKLPHLIYLFVFTSCNLPNLFFLKQLNIQQASGRDDKKA